MTGHLFMRGLSVCALLTLIVAGLPAADPAQPGQTAQKTQKEAYEAGKHLKKGVDLVRASHFLDMEVRNQQGETLATVKDIVLTEQRDGIAYVALGHGGVLGVGEKIIPVAWNEFRFQREPSKTTERSAMGESALGDLFEFQYQESHLVLNTTNEQLERTRGIGEENWPDRALPLSQQLAGQQVPTTEVSDAREQQFDSRRVSKLIGLEVRPDKQLHLTSMSRPYTQPAAQPGQPAIQPAQPAQPGQPGIQRQPGQPMTAITTEARAIDSIGEIKDVVLNVRNGRLIYGVVSLDKIDGYDDEASIVPWSALQFQTTEPRFARLSVPDAETLLAFTISEIQHRMLANQGFARGVYGAYDRQPQWETLGFVSPEPSDTQMQPRQDMQRLEEKAGEMRHELKEKADEMRHDQQQKEY